MQRADSSICPLDLDLTVVMVIAQFATVGSFISVGTTGRYGVFRFFLSLVANLN